MKGEKMPKGLPKGAKGMPMIPGMPMMPMKGGKMPDMPPKGLPMKGKGGKKGK